MSVWEKIGLIILAIAFFAVLARLAERGNRKAKNAKLAGRPELTESQFYERFYSKEGIRKDVVCYVLELIKQCIGVDSEHLRPSDSFESELREIGTPLDGSLFELFSELDYLARTCDEPISSRRIDTVDDYIRAVTEIVGDAELPININSV